jgi:hypothetical protein
MLRSGLLKWCLFGAALVGCAKGNTDGASEAGALDAEQATLVAALAANEDGNDEAWTSASGSEPFLVESCGFELIAQRVMERFDTDSSGALESEELTAITDELGDPRERLELLMSLYDTDDSGELESTELATIQTDLEARCEARRERLLETFDADGDGTLSDTELTAARDALRGRFARRHAARVDEFDGNGDGQLGPLERRRAGASIRNRVAGRRAAIAEELAAPRRAGRRSATLRPPRRDSCRGRGRGNADSTARALALAEMGDPLRERIGAARIQRRPPQLGCQPGHPAFERRIHLQPIALPDGEDATPHHAPQRCRLETDGVRNEQGPLQHRPELLEHLDHRLAPRRAGRRIALNHGDQPTPAG